MKKKELGQFGEDLAEKVLIKQGYKIIDRNFKNKLGEIDIIALKDDKICFIEVKTRNSLAFGKPFESVNYFKQNRIKKISQHFLILNKHFQNLNPRFDVISIYLPKGSKKVRLEFIPNAF